MLDSKQNNLKNAKLLRRDAIVALAASLIGTFSLSGCAKWSRLDNEPNKPSIGLPPIQMSADSMPIELIFLRLTVEQLPELDAVWPRVDEQAIPIETRRRLDRNGIRAAIVSEAIPLPLQRMIEAVDQRLQDDPMERAGLSADMPSHSRLLQCKSGQRKEVAVRPSRSGSLVIFFNNGSVAKGKTYDDAGLQLDLRVVPKEDGTATVSIQPEIQFGPFKQKIVGQQEFALRRELKRDIDTWPDLLIKHQMRPGQMLMVSATTPKRGIGEHFFFTETVSGTTEQLVLLMRLGQGKQNSVFEKNR